MRCSLLARFLSSVRFSYILIFPSRQICFEYEHSWWRWLERKFLYIFFPVVVGGGGGGGRWESHVMKNHQIEINNGFSRRVLHPCKGGERNIKAHMAHSPLNWWDSSFGWGIRMHDNFNSGKVLRVLPFQQHKTRIPSIPRHVDKYLN